MKWRCGQCGEENEFENMIDKEVIMLCYGCYVNNLKKMTEIDNGHIN